MSDNNNNYPNVTPEGIEGVELFQVPPEGTKGPTIKWGRVFDRWPEHRQLRRAKAVAGAANHALDIMQVERNALVEICKAQEATIKAGVRALEVANLALQQNTTSANELANSRVEEIVDLRRRLRLVR